MLDTEEEMIVYYAHEKNLEGMPEGDIANKVEGKFPGYEWLVKGVVAQCKNSQGEKKIISPKILDDRIGNLLGGYLAALLLFLSVMLCFSSVLNLNPTLRNTIIHGLEMFI
ncbi:MAG: hypothetical protein KDD13_00360 [Mangrovimonas sp.]|nr:hypothetical protein [Mangrovimonas sp.]